MDNSKRINRYKNNKKQKGKNNMKSFKKLAYELLPTDNSAIIEFDDLLK